VSRLSPRGDPGGPGAATVDLTHRVVTLNDPFVSTVASQLRAMRGSAIGDRWAYNYVRRPRYRVRVDRCASHLRFDPTTRYACLEVVVKKAGRTL
jgi:hypothetical protein